jgi:hypothetical protein
MKTYPITTFLLSTFLVNSPSVSGSARPPSEASLSAFIAMLQEEVAKREAAREIARLGTIGGVSSISESINSSLAEKLEADIAKRNAVWDAACLGTISGTLGTIIDVPSVSGSATPLDGICHATLADLEAADLETIHSRLSRLTRSRRRHRNLDRLQVNHAPSHIVSQVDDQDAIFQAAARNFDTLTKESASRRQIDPQKDLLDIDYQVFQLPLPAFNSIPVWTDEEKALLFYLYQLGLPMSQIALHFGVTEDICQQQFDQLRWHGFDPQPDWPGILGIITPLFPTMGHEQQVEILSRLPEDQREILRADLE